MNKKTGYFSILGLVCILIVSGCISSGGATAGNSSDPNVVNVNSKNSQLSLADYLAKVPGVNVYGSGSNVKVQIRGVNSFRDGATRPLFVVDGQRVGKSYQDVVSVVNVNEIDRVKVLKDSDAAIYGIQGGGGVIEIMTTGN